MTAALRPGLGPCVLACIATGHALVASAQVAHVAGPPGNGFERNVIVALSLADGSCAPIEAVAVSVEGGTAEPRDIIGRCARWMHVEGGGNPTTFTLRHGEVSVSAPVDLGCEDPLALEVTRTGGDVAVDAAEWTELHATGATSSTALERAGPQLIAPAPTGLAVVVAHRGGCIAVAPTGRATGPTSLVVPAAPVDVSGVAVPAAVVALADERGHATRRVPNEILAEGGAIERFEWNADELGIAWIAPDPGADRIVMEVVSRNHDPVRLEIPVRSEWPLTARIESPDSVARHRPFDVTAAVADPRGRPMRGAVLTCGGEATELGPANAGTCARLDAPGTVTVGLRVGDIVIPLDSRTVEVVEGPPSADAGPPDATTPLAEPTEIALTFSLGGGIDGWGVPNLGAGLGLVLGHVGSLALGAELRYTAGIVNAADTQDPASELTGLRYGFDALGTCNFTVLGGKVPLVAHFGVGPTVTWDALAVDGQGSSGAAIGFAGLLAIGSEARLGALTLGARLGMRASVGSSRRWDAHPLRFFLEVNGAVPL